MSALIRAGGARTTRRRPTASAPLRCTPLSRRRSSASTPCYSGIDAPRRWHRRRALLVGSFRSCRKGSVGGIWSGWRDSALRAATAFAAKPAGRSPSCGGAAGQIFRRAPWPAGTRWRPKCKLARRRRDANRAAERLCRFPAPLRRFRASEIESATHAQRSTGQFPAV